MHACMHCCSCMQGCVCMHRCTGNSAGCACSAACGRLQVLLLHACMPRACKPDCCTHVHALLQLQTLQRVLQRACMQRCKGALRCSARVLPKHARCCTHGPLQLHARPALHAHPCTAACTPMQRCMLCSEGPPRPPHPSPLFADDVSVLLQEIITEARNLSNAEM